LVAGATMHAIHSEGAVGVLSARATVVAISVCAVFTGVGACLPRGLKREAEYKANDLVQHVVQIRQGCGEGTDARCEPTL
jgi:hypothetical protein